MLAFKSNLVWLEVCDVAHVTTQNTEVTAYGRTQSIYEL